MEYRTLGKTGLKVSALGFGASPLGGGVFGDVEESVAVRTVETAVDLGINFIDVAPYYGITRAETVLGKALRNIPRDRYYLATKVGRYGDAEFDFSARRVTASVNESLDRLGVDYVDLIQSHDNEYGNLDQVIQETLPALRKVQQAGKARFVGVSGYPLKIFDSILCRAEVDTILSYNHYSLNNTRLLKLLPLLKEQNIGVINAASLSHGLLTNQGAPAWHPAPPEIKEACAQAADYCRSRNFDLAKLALQFSLANPEIATTLVGMADPEYVRKNVEWMQEPIDQAMLQAVMKILSPVQDQSWIVGRLENN